MKEDSQESVMKALISDWHNQRTASKKYDPNFDMRKRCHRTVWKYWKLFENKGWLDDEVDNKEFERKSNKGKKHSISLPIKKHRLNFRFYIEIKKTSKGLDNKDQEYLLRFLNDLFSVKEFREFIINQEDSLISSIDRLLFYVYRFYAEYFYNDLIPRGEIYNSIMEIKEVGDQEYVKVVDYIRKKIPKSERLYAFIWVYAWLLQIGNREVLKILKRIHPFLDEYDTIATWWESDSSKALTSHKATKKRAARKK